MKYNYLFEHDNKYLKLKTKDLVEILNEADYA
jgi:hypothetical protein